MRTCVHHFGAWMLAGKFCRGSCEKHNLLRGTGDLGTSSMWCRWAGYPESVYMAETVRKWVKAVSEGRDDMEDEPRPGRPVTACGDANISKVLVSLSDDRRKTYEQKESRVNFSRNFLRRFQTEQNDFLGRIITGDETWVYSWDPETKRQSAEWRDFDEPRPEKVRRKQGALKVMHMIFFDMNGVILRWPVPISTTINAQYYKKVLQDKLRPAI
ncbi:hypothetical protein RRG08_054515 [Elysia crispata]|uniref:Transposase n=1 Tax=Elysia crispata TaxID=231223 RepID=A0AAE0YCS6_9GAST|nr:hypothetical protein RRG08_054515 [Elysia crispata]